MELPIDHRCEFAFLSSEDKDETCRRMSPRLSFLGFPLAIVSVAN